MTLLKMPYWSLPMAIVSATAQHQEWLRPPSMDVEDRETFKEQGLDGIGRDVLLEQADNYRCVKIRGHPRPKRV